MTIIVFNIFSNITLKLVILGIFNKNNLQEIIFYNIQLNTVNCFYLMTTSM